MVSWTDLDPEEIKAKVRMAYGSGREFEVLNGLPAHSFHDTLRGRPNAAVQEVIIDFLNGRLTPPKERPPHRRAVARR